MEKMEKNYYTGRDSTQTEKRKILVHTCRSHGENISRFEKLHCEISPIGHSNQKLKATIGSQLCSLFSFCDKRSGDNFMLIGQVNK